VRVAQRPRPAHQAVVGIGRLVIPQAHAHQRVRVRHVHRGLPVRQALHDREVLIADRHGAHIAKPGELRQGVLHALLDARGHVPRHPHRGGQQRTCRQQRPALPAAARRKEYHHHTCRAKTEPRPAPPRRHQSAQQQQAARGVSQADRRWQDPLPAFAFAPASQRAHPIAPRQTQRQRQGQPHKSAERVRLAERAERPEVLEIGNPQVRRARATEVFVQADDRLQRGRQHHAGRNPRPTALARKVQHDAHQQQHLDPFEHLGEPRPGRCRRDQ